ncbi:MAG: DMT family transporter [Thermoanaerobaculia bacterium]|nr:DMT family transporter [Thermoanaerobaculia bacterium]
MCWWRSSSGASRSSRRRRSWRRSPAALIFARAGLGSLLLFGFLTLRREAPPPRDAWGALALMGFVGVALHGMLQAYALTLTSAVKSGWLIGLIPLWSAVLAAVFLGERFGRRKAAGLALGFLGAVLVVTGGRLGSDVLRLPSTRGDLLFIVSTVNWAVYSVLGHRTLRRLGPFRATAGAMAAGWLFLLPLFLAARGWSDYGRLSATGWAALLFLGIGASGLGYLFWYGALERIEASRVAAFLYLEPLVTLAAAVVLLGEAVTLEALAGGLLLLAGVAVVQRAPSARRRESPKEKSLTGPSG